jgi:hypothetical protein
MMERMCMNQWIQWQSNSLNHSVLIHNVNKGGVIHTINLVAPALNDNEHGCMSVDYWHT